MFFSFFVFFALLISAGAKVPYFFISPEKIKICTFLGKKVTGLHGFLRQMGHFLTGMSNRVEHQNEPKRPQSGG